MAIYKYDFLVIGSGAAGLLAAHKLAKAGRVAIITKRSPDISNTNLAQGGIAAVTDPDDNFKLHIADTLRTGAGLSDPRVVKLTVSEAPSRIRELVALGMRFTLKKGVYELGLEGGHSRRRILHAADATGHEIERSLLETCMADPGITFFPYYSAVDLILRSRPARVKPAGNFCLGVYALEDCTGQVHSFLARTTLLASGGAGKVYRYTSNPDVTTGDGMAMAYRAGLELVNMEFVQFHPTCLYHPQAKSFLISEALRGEGGILRGEDGKAFMKNYSRELELAPRDIVARAIDSELKRTGADCVYLDMTHLKAPFLKRRFPTIFAKCLQLGIDIAKIPIPVVPAAHFFCGGVRSDEHGRTAMPGLCAIGEVSHTGLHGANRLASNSLLETCVFAHRAAEAIKADRLRRPAPGKPSHWTTGNARPSDEAVLIKHNWDEIRTLMWNYVGIVRSNKRLARASARIKVISEEIIKYYWDFLPTRDLLELRNIACLADVIIRSARSRKESRGLHYTVDYPKPSSKYRKPTVIDRYRREKT
ncbi:MAG: L-aspartate oxidase [Elusimicrobia bacterium CG_4_10_14_0_2_um_filter_56_8]|nr:MAG: L-aspartate oxidase [Elusimicrobia bacterium CG1_02_56_21]PJA15608.1 MAG: L-aspartate oxidase [Elusimicrobia bacterium CG_4_10_14_0_2_um_filter_56_8]